MKPTKSALKYIQIGKEIEKKGLSFYKKSLRQAMDPNSKNLLKFLISEEENHLELFTAMEKELKIEKIKKHKVPLFKKTDYKKIHNSPTTIKIFFIALEMEERGIAFYTKTAEKLKDKKLKKFLLSLADMEKEHFRLIKTHQDALYNEWYWEAMGQPRFNT